MQSETSSISDQYWYLLESVSMVVNGDQRLETETHGAKIHTVIFMIFQGGSNDLHLQKERHKLIYLRHM